MSIYTNSIVNEPALLRNEVDCNLINVFKVEQEQTICKVLVSQLCGDKVLKGNI